MPKHNTDLFVKYDDLSALSQKAIKSLDLHRKSKNSPKTQMTLCRTQNKQIMKKNKAKDKNPTETKRNTSPQDDI